LKHLITISLFFALIACNNLEKPQVKKPIPSLKEQKDTIVQLFGQWKKEQIENGNYLADEYCDPEWMMKQYENENYQGPSMGFQTEKEGYGYSYGDINLDGRLDGMISFDPIQCDGGKALMWYTANVLIISDGENYKITDTVDFSSFGNTEFDARGIYQIGKISGQKAYGTYIEFLKDDLPSWPSIYRDVIFDFPSRKLIHLGDYFKLSTKHKPNIVYCDMDGDKRKDTVKMVQNTANEKYGLAIEFGNGKSKYLGMGEQVLGQEFDDLEWVGQFEKVSKGEVVWNNVIGGEIVTEDQIPEENKVKLPFDGILIHQLESCGGGIIYMKNGKFEWIQQE